MVAPLFIEVGCLSFVMDCPREVKGIWPGLDDEKSIYYRMSTSNVYNRTHMQHKNRIQPSTLYSQTIFHSQFHGRIFKFLLKIDDETRFENRWSDLHRNIVHLHYLFFFFFLSEVCMILIWFLRITSILMNVRIIYNFSRINECNFYISHAEIPVIECVD